MFKSKTEQTFTSYIIENKYENIFPHLLCDMA